MRYLSVCSGIEAASCAWQPLGWTPVAFSEIEPFPCAVLKHHYPDVPNWGDMTKYQEWPDATIDLLCGGTPCQSFSVAGLRKGLADPRGNLALTYLAIADKYRPQWVVWENVPGVLSSESHDGPDPRMPEGDLDGDNGPKDGEEVVVEDEYDADETHAFHCFLAGLSELGYGFAYRVLDAQHFGVPQRRRRVFVVGCLGDWRAAAAVLFERHSLSGNPAPSREAREGLAADAGCGFETAGTLDARVDGGGFPETDGATSGHVICAAHGQGGAEIAVDRAPTLTCNHEAPIAAYAIQAGALRENPESGPDGVGVKEGLAYTLEARAEVQAVCASGEISHTLKADGHDGSEDGTGRGVPVVAFVQNSRDEVRMMGGDGQVVGAIAAEPGAKHQCYLAFQSSQSGVRLNETHATLDANNGPRRHSGVMTDMQVRRLIPEECEKLQGFKPGYTQVPYRGKPAADGPRYKSLGNSWAVPCAAWIGQRIENVLATLKTNT